MLKVIDKRDGYEITKRELPTGKLVCYQVKPLGMINGDYGAVVCCMTLQRARQIVVELIGGTYDPSASD